MFLKFFVDFIISRGVSRSEGLSAGVRFPFISLIPRLFDVPQLWRGVWVGHTRLQILTNQRPKVDFYRI